MADEIRVEIAYAEVSRAILRQLTLPAHSNVADALAASAIVSELQLDMSQLTLGIWSKPVTTQTVLSDGDRIELYRQLTIAPMDARRKRAKKLPK